MSADSLFMPHLDTVLIEQAYRSGAGNEIDSGKMSSPESSAALVANSFGFFLSRPEDLPPVPGTEDLGWPATDVKPEVYVRFPRRGGRHPWLDVLVETRTHLIGIESKRFEPFQKRQETVAVRCVHAQRMGHEDGTCGGIARLTS